MSDWQILSTGVPLEEAKAVMIMIHGRGATAESILGLAQEFNTQEFAYLAPQAPMNTWYPQRFIMPRASNEPHLSNALDLIGSIVDRVVFTRNKIIILGFSQGGCLAVEYAARNPQKLGGVVALSGGLIGAESELIGYTGSMDDTPVFIGCSDVDFHIPVERVQQTTSVMRHLGAKVEERIYPGMGHTINQDEINYIDSMMAGIIAG